MSTPPIILILDDDSSHRAMLRTVLRGWGYATDEADDGDTAVEKVKERAYDAVLSDVRMARMDGISAIREILHHNPSIPVLVMTAWQSVETAVAALRLGAYDYLEKPLDFDLLHLTLERALDHTRLAAENRELREYIRESPSGLLGRSPRMRELIEMVNTVAPTEATVLITGESGTGKERVARAIQEASARRGKAFVTVNCAALNESLLESELFGHEKGAFTGADKRRDGRFLQADGGTLFLDEIGDLPLELQPKLLRVLQEREIERLGGSRTIPVNVRVIAATNRDLWQMVEDRQFRSDLFYRLNVFPLELPPLRDRPEDIPLLAKHFTQKMARHMNRAIDAIPTEALRQLMSWDWPGNVRELENVIERAVLLTRGNSLNLHLNVRQSRLLPTLNEDSALRSSMAQLLHPTTPENDEEERQRIVQVLRETNGIVAGPRGAATRLGMKRTTLLSRMQRLGISVREVL